MDRTLSLKLAPIQETDLDRLVEIGRKSAERIGDVLSFTRCDLLAMLSWARLGPSGFLAIKDEGVIVGMVRYLRFLDSSPPLVLGLVTVDPEFRQDEVGDWAYREILERARADGALALDAMADSRDREAIGFLRRRGFEQLVTLWTLEADPDFAPGQAPRVPEGFRLRTYRKGEDADRFADLCNRAFDQHLTFYATTPADTQSIETTPLFDPNLTIFLETTAGEPVGVSRSTIRGDVRDAWIDVLGVIPEYQGQGLGRFLLLHSMFVLAQSRPKAIRLMVEGVNEKARALYDSEGFSELRTRIRFRKPLS